MPENTDPSIIVEKTLDPAENNSDVARKLAEQDQTLKPSKPEALLDAGSALDALLTEKQKPKVDEAPVVPPPEKPAEKAPADTATPPPPVEDPHKKRAEELFKDSPALPPGASPKSSEAFSAVKIKAAQEISAREQQLADLQKKNKELEEKLKTTVPEALTKELEDLRQFRSRLDIEADPKFKEFDSAVERTREFIYSQLKQSPAVTEEVIAAIKKHGGPENVNLDKLFEAIKDPAIRRVVDSAVMDIEKTKFNKEETIKAAKANVQSYVAERQKQFEQLSTSHAEQTKAKLDPYLQNLEWMKPREIPTGADEATKKSAEEHNAFVVQTSQGLQAALQDDTPEMRAILLTGMAQLLNLQRVHEGMAAENKTLKAEVAKLTEQVNKFKTGSTTRLRENAAAPGAGGTPEPKPADMVNMRPSDALDAIAKSISEQRAKAAAGT